MTSAAALIEPQARAKGIAFSSSCAADCQVHADPDKVQQVIVNLLPRGMGGELTATCAATTPGSTFVFSLPRFA